PSNPLFRRFCRWPRIYRELPPTRGRPGTLSSLPQQLRDSRAPTRKSACSISPAHPVASSTLDFSCRAVRKASWCVRGTASASPAVCPRDNGRRAVRGLWSQEGRRMHWPPNRPEELPAANPPPEVFAKVLVGSYAGFYQIPAAVDFASRGAGKIG